MTWRTRFTNWPSGAVTARDAGELYRAAAAGHEANGDHERAAELRKQARLAERRDRIGEWSHHAVPSAVPVAPVADPRRCSICRRLLDVPGQRDSIDCGGDCQGCMREAEAEIERDG